MSAVLPVEALFPRRLPWRRIFDDMKDRGYAYSKQATLIGVGWSTFGRWMEKEGGPEPRHSEAVALLAMHTAICGFELTLQRQREGVLRG